MSVDGRKRQFKKTSPMAVMGKEEPLQPLPKVTAADHLPPFPEV
jgi:hypothetical protein